jgi:ABC-type branched-subunit amino acid transport system ATPase component
VRPFWRLSVRQHLLAAAAFGVRYGRRPIDVGEILDLTGLALRADDSAHTLTLALCKRLEIARALATGARLLLLDETMAGLTPEETRDAVGLVRRVRERGCRVILIEHVLAAVLDLCDRAVVLDYGEVIADGPPADVLRRPEVRQAYLGEV